MILNCSNHAIYFILTTVMFVNAVLVGPTTEQFGEKGAVFAGFNASSLGFPYDCTFLRP